MFQIFLLPVLKSFLLPILIKCSLCGSAAQAHPAAWMGESSVPLVWSQLHKVTWEGQPGLGRAVSTHPPGSHCSWCRRRRRRDSLLLPKYSVSTNTAVTLHLCSPWSLKQQGNETKLSMRQEGALPCAGWGSTAGMAAADVGGLWQQLLLRQEGQEAPPSPSARAVSSPKLSLLWYYFITYQHCL